MPHKVGAGLLLLLGVVALSVAEPQSAPRTLTLAEAYALASARSETLGIAAAEWRAAEWRYREATGDRWPELRAEADSVWRDAPRDNDRDRASALGLGGSHTIFGGFRTTHLMEAREQDQLAAGFTLERERQLLYQDVSDAFYQALANTREFILWGDQLQALQARVDDLDGRVVKGRSRQAELLSAQVQVADARAAIAAANGQADAARELLSFLVGQSVNDTTLADDSPLPDVGLLTTFLDGLAARPDVKAGEARVAAARAETGAIDADRNVTVTLDGAVALWTDPDDTPAWDVTLRAELPLFDRGQRRAAGAEARELTQISELHLARLQRSADRDVRLAHRLVISALAQWTALNEAVRLAEENVAVQRRDYELGRANNLDVLTALVQAYNLQRRQTGLELAAKAAIVRLHVAAGAVTP